MSQSNKLALLKTNTEQYCKALQPVTILDCVNSKAPTIKEISEEAGHDQVLAAIGYLLLETVEMFAVGKSIGVEQFAKLPQMIYDDANYLGLEDLKLCFLKAIKGHYGKSYDRLDAQIIFEWLNAYKAERADVKMNYQVQKHDEFKQLDQKVSDLGWSKERLTQLKELAKQMAIKDREERFSKRSKVEPTNEQNFANKCLRQFDTLYIKFGIKGGVKMVKRYGKILDAHQFLNYKFSQYEKINHYIRTRSNRNNR